MREVESQLIGLLNQTALSKERRNKHQQRPENNEKWVKWNARNLDDLCVYKNADEDQRNFSPNVAAADSCCCPTQLKVQYVKDW